MINKGTYSVVNPSSDEGLRSHVIDFAHTLTGVDLHIVDVDALDRPQRDDTVSISFERQQLAELGGLLLFLGGDKVDLDSIPELLQGYGVSDDDLSVFASRCRMLADLVDGL